MPGIDGLPQITYPEVLVKIGTGRAHVLVGNGFSIACDPVFRYSSLFEAAVKSGLSDRAQLVFQRLGTNNFEGVLRLLEDAYWIGMLYGLDDELMTGIRQDAEIVKQTLVEAVTSSHLDHTGRVPDVKKEAAGRFLATYYNIFTTNYDLLLYWTILHTGKPSHQDGFRADDDDPEAPYLVFAERLGENKGLFFLHGALHFYIADWGTEETQLAAYRTATYGPDSRGPGLKGVSSLRGGRITRQETRTNSTRRLSLVCTR